MAAEPPPTLLLHDPPLLVEGPAEVAALAAEAAKRVAARGTSSMLEDIINSILPPRCAQRGGLAARAAPCGDR